MARKTLLAMTLVLATSASARADDGPDSNESADDVNWNVFTLKLGHLYAVNRPRESATDDHPPGGSQGNSEADLTGAIGHGKGHDPVDAHGREEEDQQAKSPGDLSAGPLLLGGKGHQRLGGNQPRNG